MKAMNKKGAEMTIGTIIIIILALVVLVILIYGFSTGWGNLWDRIIGFGGGKVNVQSVVQSCDIACSTGATYDYCNSKRNVVFSTDKKDSLYSLNGAYTCGTLPSAANYAKCSAIDCESVERGTCSGTVTPTCPGNTNIGKTECEKKIGCGWTDDATNNNEMVGTCTALATKVQCSKYNNDRVICESLESSGCTWTPAA